MKKIAVVLCGQARYLEEGAWWFKNRVFPESDELQVDYYCYFWGDNEVDLPKRIVNTFNPVKYGIGDYNKSFHAHRHAVRMTNKDIEWDETIDPFVQNVICYKPDDFDKYSYNFPGMFLSSAEAFRMIGKETLDQYDVVIRTRSDVCIENVNINNWKNIIRNFQPNSIHCHWIECYRGINVIADLAFYGKSDTMWEYFNDFDSKLYRLATTHKNVFSDYSIIEDKNKINVPLGHVVWTKASLFSETRWRRLFWYANMRHGIKIGLFRNQISIEELEKLSYLQIENMYAIEEKRRHNL